jgi:hypothetical protein
VLEGGDVSLRKKTVVATTTFSMTYDDAYTAEPTDAEVIEVGYVMALAEERRPVFTVAFSLDYEMTITEVAREERPENG